jgi:N-acetylglucosaminyl-diphospho-decaprenol L-rhamnosyltransferase
VSVAILFVNFRVYDDLDRSLTALYPFLSADDEIVVVDNASEPDRLAWLTSRHARVRAIPSNENLGFAAGVNLAASQSSSPFLLLLNPDTVVHEPIVSVLSQWLRDHPDTAVAGPRVLNPDGTVQASARRFPGISAALGGRSTWLTERFPNNWVSRRHLLGRDATVPLDVDWIAGACLMTTRAAFEKAGGFDEHFFLFWEDADYCRRVKAMGFRCTYLPTVSVRHAGGHSAELVPELAIRAFHTSALQLHLKHGGVLARLTAPLATAAMRMRMEWCVRRAARSGRAPINADPRSWQP